MTSSPLRDGNALIKKFEAWNGDPANTNSTGQPIDAWRNGLTAGVGADKLILESLEHARARNAEILAEIVVDGISGGAYFTNPENCDASYRVIDAVLQETEFKLDDPHSAMGDHVCLPRGDVLETVAPGTSFYASGRDHTVGRLAAVACVFVLVLFAGIFNRQDLGTTAAQTRGALTLAAARLSSHPLARNAELIARSPTTEQRPRGTGSELSGRGAMVTGAVLATTNSVVATMAGTSLTQVQEQQAEVTITANLKHLRELTIGTTAVIVQPDDDLRQICLRHLGHYNAVVLRDIRESNPEISDPDRITVGQRIFLPTSASVGTNALRLSVGSEQ